MEGWVKVHRKIVDWGWSDDPNMVSLFLHMLVYARRKDGEYQGIFLRRGQFIFGRKEWSKKVGVSEQRLRTCINRLKSTNEITTESTNKFTVITIVKYEEYQHKDNEPTSTSTNTSTSDQPATNQQSTSNQPHIERKKEEKEEKEERVEGVSDEPPPLPEKDPPKKTEKPKKEDRGSYWKPPDQIPEKFWEYAHNDLEWSDHRIQQVYEKFSDYWQAESGQKARKKDWLAAWRVWCRNERSYQNKGKNNEESKSREQLAKEAILRGTEEFLSTLQ